ncbi:MAG TPA: tetratricopeptide repeat protein, partial [Parachlamydiaceae bacterium]|nr:tetratricopeptide repeat protein [Parachlamydiaceae bacterium]
LTEGNDPGIFYAKGWYMRALNDFENGKHLQETQSSHASHNSFKRSALAFRTAFELLKENDKQQAGAALKFQALATSYSNEAEVDTFAFQILDELIHGNPTIWEAVSNKDEIFYLHGYFAGRISQNKDPEKNLEISKQSLQTAASIPNNTFGDQSLSYLASLYYKNKDYKNAEAAYMQLADTFPTSPLAAEAWLGSACCADHLQDDLKTGKERRQYTYENFPHTPHAAEAFFTYYTYPEYLQGDRTTIKHLQAFADNYSESPFLLDANYLIGLDYKRDRKSTAGRWIRKKSLTDAIDSFQKAEVLFDEYYEKNLIPADKLDYYTAMRYRATLERAMINLAIADDAQGAKKQIYLDYAEEVFKNLSSELKSQKNPYIQRLFQENAYPLIEEESSFWLAQTYIKAGKDNEAEQILAEMADRYKKAGTARGYYLSRTLDEQGRVAMRKNDFQGALTLFDQAEEAAKGNVLSTDQKLDIWIQQSLCCRGLNHFDEAILILSKVINDDAISALRVKAMYLRAETYELQKRPELARKQLESMVKKGGIWAKKAQEKLDMDASNNHLKDDHGH